LLRVGVIRCIRVVHRTIVRTPIVRQAKEGVALVAGVVGNGWDIQHVQIHACPPSLSWRDEAPAACRLKQAGQPSRGIRVGVYNL